MILPKMQSRPVMIPVIDRIAGRRKSGLRVRNFNASWRRIMLMIMINEPMTNEIDSFMKSVWTHKKMPAINIAKPTTIFEICFSSSFARI